MNNQEQKQRLKTILYIKSNKHVVLEKNKIQSRVNYSLGAIRKVVENRRK